MKELSNRKKVVLNLFASGISYAVTFGINFFLSPYIVKTIGVEANGFVALANNFISYAALITIALNALSGRFITVRIYEGKNEEANKYFTSVFYANTFLAFVLLLIGAFVCIFLEHLINIPDRLYWDVKILFAVLFLNCVLNTITSVFGVSTFATNKLYLNSIRNIESSIARALIIIGLFAFFPPKVFYLGITTLLMSMYCISYNIYYMHKLTPFLKIRKTSFDFKAVVELVTSGIWNLIVRIGQILSDGLDLLISNLLINATSMGVLSLAKTVPGAIAGIVGTIVNSFSPNFTILYAEKKYDELVASLKRSMKIMGILCNIPIVVLIVCGERFFKLWQPTQDPKELQILSILTCAGLIFSGGINCIYNIFTVVNKLKYNSLCVVFGGFLSTVIVFILLKTTNLGLYAVAAVSTIVNIIRNIVFTAPYGAKCLKLKWYVFYPDIIRPVLFVIISVIPGYFINKAVPGDSWFSLIIMGLIILAISLCIGFYVILGKKERTYIFDILKAKVFKKSIMGE